MLAQTEPASTKAPVRLTILEGLTAAESVWRNFEASGAVLTPYQRYDWIAGLAAACGHHRIIVVVMSVDGAPIALLPLALSTRFGVTSATIPGSDLGNSDFLIMARGAEQQLDTETIKALFAELSTLIPGLDLISFSNLPASFDGIANPLLAFEHQAAADHFYIAPIGPGAESRLPKKRRVDIERGIRRLEETMGPVTLCHAKSIEEIDAAHAAFLAHRNLRFKEMGVHNIFADDYFIAFFRNMAIAGLGVEKPALCFDVLRVDGEIVATAVGTYTATHYSQYINSNTDGPASKYSLVGMLMFKLLDQLKETGVTSMDMGVGDFTYKTSWADMTEVYDAAVPLSAKGRMFSMGLKRLRQVKRAVKKNKRLFALAKRVRMLGKKSPSSPPGQDQSHG